MVTTIDLIDENEFVALASEDETGMLGIGSRSSISLADPRSGKIELSFPSLDNGWGVRSLNFRGGHISIGGGQGRLSFFDIKASKYLKVAPDTEYLTISPGWVKTAPTPIVLVGQNENHAIYTHQWDPTGSRLFVGGGPLFLASQGCYAAVWR